LDWDWVDKTCQNCTRGLQKIFLLWPGRKLDSPKPSSTAQVRGNQILIWQIERRPGGQTLHRKIEKLNGLFLKFPGEITET